MSAPVGQNLREKVVDFMLLAAPEVSKPIAQDISRIFHASDSNGQMMDKRGILEALPSLLDDLEQRLSDTIS